MTLLFGSQSSNTPPTFMQPQRAAHDQLECFMSIISGIAPDSISKLLLTAREAARALAISERTLWSLTNNGDIPSVRIGRAVRYDPRDLDRWIERQKQPAGGNAEM
jgi:excisionase family DNA binding protein